MLSVIGGSAAAEDFTVISTPYRVNHTLVSQSLWNTYELSAGNDQRITYSMTITTPGACASLYFVKGHNPSARSEYFVTYSQEGCVRSYSNSFPVEAADGTDFAVLILTGYNGDVDYSLVIDLLVPVVPAWVLGLGILAVIGVAPLGLYFLWQRLRAPRWTQTGFVPTDPQTPSLTAPSSPPGRERPPE